jgi:serine/threonine protein phosphatase PrpC
MDNQVIPKTSKLSALVLDLVLNKLTQDRDKQLLILTDIEALAMTQRYVAQLQHKIKKLSDDSKTTNDLNAQLPVEVIKMSNLDNQDTKKYEFPMIENDEPIKPVEIESDIEKVISLNNASQIKRSMPTTNANAGLEKSVSEVRATEPTTSKQLNKGDSISLSSGKVDRTGNEPTETPRPAEISKPEAEVLPKSESLKPGQTPVPPEPVKPMPPLITAKFNLPNAKVGESYQHAIKGIDSLGREVKVTDMRIPEDLGLKFLADIRVVAGTPTYSGDLKLSLRYEVMSGEKYSGEMILIVNPDPKSLWKVIEPDASLPFPKPHTDGKRIELDSLTQLVAASRRGRSHEHGGLFRDDDFYMDTDPVSGWSVIIVADGAGSATYSREGSRIAVTTAGKALTELLKSTQGGDLTVLLESVESDKLNKLGNKFHYIFHQVCSSAVTDIEEAASAAGEQPRAFATTFLAAVVKPYGEQYFVASFWLGDGAIAIYEPNGAVKLMGSPDGGEYAGQTLFLDRSALSAPSFGKRTSISVFDKKAVLLLMTDGVSDPYFETDNGLADRTRWKKLWDEIEPKLKEADPKQALIDWLHFFIQGHHDDRTIALLNTSTACSE